jgi:DNA-binding HxlR family transcriptional regulator
MDFSEVSPLAKDDVLEASPLPVGYAVTVEPLLHLLTNEAPLLVHPKMTLNYGLTEAIFFRQLCYWLIRSKQKQKSIRFSYTGWQRQMPFVSRRWIIEIVQRLEEMGLIEVHREGRVNRISLIEIDDHVLKNEVAEQHGDHDGKYHWDDKFQAKLLLFPTLADVVGIREAIILQQVHLRSYGYTADPKQWNEWARKSIQQWHQCLMFISARTLEKLFRDLVRDQLLIRKKVNGPGGGMNAYRVGYDKLKAIMAGQTTRNPVVDWAKCPELKEALKEKSGPISKFAGPIPYTKPLR